MPSRCDAMRCDVFVTNNLCDASVGIILYIYIIKGQSSPMCVYGVMWYADISHSSGYTQHTRRSLAGRKIRSQFSISTLAIIFIRPISKLISFAASRQGPHTMARFEAGMRFEADAAATLEESGEKEGSVREFQYIICSHWRPA